MTTGRRYGGADAQRVAIVDVVADEGKVLETAIELVQRSRTAAHSDRNIAELNC